MFHVKRISTGSPFEAEFAYSRALVKGDWCFVAGVTGYDYRSMRMPDGAAEQARACFRTIEAVLAEAGFGLSDLVRVTYILAEQAVAEEIAPVLREVLGDIRPPATMYVAGLIRPAMRLEVEVTAFRG
jgi:Putative translation initiation inhibitor, yjgF family